MKGEYFRSRRTWFKGTLLAMIVLVVVGHGTVLRGFASFLIVEDSLERAAAIIVLAGHLPFREMEAANLYRAGLAPQMIIVRPARSAESEALELAGINKPEPWELSREFLIKQGVPAKDILVLAVKEGGTLEELQAVYSAMASKDAPVILVTSKFHTRRTRLTWQYVTAGRSPPIVRAATADPFDPNRWWHKRNFVSSVVHEYLGLINYYTKFAVAP